MKIGIIGPCEDEIVPFIEKMDNVSVESHVKLKFHSGTYSGLNIVALFSGICKVNAAIAAQMLINKYNVTHIIVTGVAGAIDVNLKIFDTVISSEITYHDVEEKIFTQYHPWMKSLSFKGDSEMVDALLKANADDTSVSLGKIVTGEAFIDHDGRDEIIKKHNPQCVDMETAAAAHVCYVNEIPFLAIRSISDTPLESGVNSFEKYSKDAAKKSIKVLIKYLESI